MEGWTIDLQQAWTGGGNPLPSWVKFGVYCSFPLSDKMSFCFILHVCQLAEKLADVFNPMAELSACPRSFSKTFADPFVPFTTLTTHPVQRNWTPLVIFKDQHCYWCIPCHMHKITNRTRLVIWKHPLSSFSNNTFCPSDLFSPIFYSFNSFPLLVTK